MYTGHSGLPIPVPVPALAKPVTVSVPSRAIAAPHLTPSPVPVPVPLASSPLHTAATLTSSSSYVPTVPRPVAVPASVPAPQPIGAFATPSPAFAVTTAWPSASINTTAPAPPAAPPPPLPVSFVGVSATASSSSSSSSSGDTPAMPLPVTAASASNSSAPWMQVSTPSPPPLTSVHTPPPPLPASVTRSSTTKTVTFSLPGEDDKAPTATPSIPTPLSSALRTSTPSIATPTVPTPGGPGSSSASATVTAASATTGAVPSVMRLHGPTAVPLASATLPSFTVTTSAARTPTSSAATPVVQTPPVPALSKPSPLSSTLRGAAPVVASVGAHHVSPATSTTATLVVPPLPHNTAPAASNPPVPVPQLPTLPRSASLSIPSLPVPVAPPTAPSPPSPSTSAPVVPAAVVVPEKAPLPALHTVSTAPTAVTIALPEPLPLPIPTLPAPVGFPRPLSAPAPTLYATEEEAPTTPAAASVVVQEVERDIPDYSAWLYPVTLFNATVMAKPELKFPLAGMKVPQLLSAPSLLQWCEADVLASLPPTLPPEYVIFGGARYSGAPLDLLRPPLVPRVPARRTSAYYEAAEAQRLQFLHDQLEVAKNYLKIEARRMAGVRLDAVGAGRAGISPLPVSVVLPSATEGAGDVLVKLGEEEDLSKATVWTTAYFGTPRQLYHVITSKKFDGMLTSTGYVQYRRRKWGLKRAGETFVLGLGMKATALQFAAAAGKLDSVVLLLTNGARDSSTPFLKEILSKASMAMIASICAPRARPARVRCPATMEEEEEANMHDTHFTTMSTFVSEQVTCIDDGAYTQAGTAPSSTTTYQVVR